MKYQSIKRSCTDFFCWIIFVVFWVAFAYVSLMGYNKGDLNNLAATFDADKMQCGKNDRKDYPYLFINDFNIKFNKKNTICVKSCPKNKNETLSCYNNSKLTCSSLNTYKSIEVMNRICIPFNDENINFKSLNSFINIEYADIYYESTLQYWKIISGSFLTAFFVGLLYSILVEILAIYLVYIFIFFFVIFCLFTGYLSFIKLDENNDLKVNYNIELPIKFNNTNYYNYFAYLLWFIGGLTIILVYFFKNSIKIASSVMEITSEFIAEVTSALFIPFFVFIFCITFIIGWGASFAFLFSVGNVVDDENSIFGKIEREEMYNYLIGFSIFALFWGLSFLNQLNSFLIIFCAIEWSINIERFSFSFPLIKGLFLGLFYHTGTIAFGSFILAIVWTIQFIVEIIIYGTKSENQNLVQKFFARCFSYLIYLFEKFVKMINKQAFCDTILNSTSFCTAAKTSFSLVVEHIAEFSILSMLISLFNIIASIFISCLTTLIYYYYFTKKIIQVDGVEENNFYAPLVIIFIISYIVSYLFISVYDNASLAILYCSIKGDLLNIPLKKEIDLLFDLRPKDYQLLELDKGEKSE